MLLYVYFFMFDNMVLCMSLILVFFLVKSLNCFVVCLMNMFSSFAISYLFVLVLRKSCVLSGVYIVLKMMENFLSIDVGVGVFLMFGCILIEVLLVKTLSTTLSFVKFSSDIATLSYVLVSVCVCLML